MSQKKCNCNYEFVRALLDKLHISSHIIDNPDEYIGSEIDSGLRAMLFAEDNYSKLLLNSPNEAKENVIYRFFDEYLCHYIFFKIPNTKGNKYFYIGPYIKALPSEDFILKKSNQLSLSEAQIEQYRIYYRNLPVIEEENTLFCIADTLGSFIWGSTDNFDVEYINYEIPDKRKPIYSDSVLNSTETMTPSLTLEMLEQNYQNEKKLMEAISKGKLNKIDIIVSTVLNQGTEERLGDSLRNRKNYLIILNTLLRKSAEFGEVHPFHIHRLSSHFAEKIESLFSIEDSLELQKEMIRKYCLLVKEHSLKKYSNLVGRVITLISYDLSSDLSLKNISANLNVNASYLSATFKKECGETLTDYVRRKRMENAAYILTHTDKQIQIVAEECGIMDLNYFIKLFKRHYGMTPTQYRNLKM